MSDEPIWRRDFPYTAAGEEGVTRREFTRFLVAASVAVAGGSGVVSTTSSHGRVLRMLTTLARRTSFASMPANMPRTSIGTGP